MSKLSFVLAIAALAIYMFVWQPKLDTPSDITPVPQPTQNLLPQSSDVLDNPQETQVKDITPTVLVKRVIDGDTIEIEGGQKVRYIGIDTPESTTKTECFGKEATNKNKLLVEGREVTLEKDVSETDKFGRLLRYVYVGNLMVNQELVLSGYANASSYPPDIKYQELFRTSEKEAREQGRGLWGNCAAASQTPSSSNTTSDECSIKGNISKSTSEKIYHLPGGKFYNQTVIGDTAGERFFCSEKEAQSYGWRKSKL
ncbi:MAG: hypothetical protein A3F33_01165 [Candidatus Woykebacteria bacterium RIFCSPHIGHO2_12_FULL_43_10]|uniref:TNase-like domain-containing protein n=2 Tax=Candidatus Woykeibacteriota TaxID=1817899 RepID=A0A1G1WWA8_9BACT|nr:MAG: hypothetical protein A3F33_01165 [Candidatus Woykebacteria bacterium RIFCSPHIGHO2_12_FULL_43_10]OGY30027.1 MAG: hypothetical protein A3J50_03015 [Candidatus Woykebacteria bacterium RIFCSPHIGHO2_02_FULL_43_16b]OGY31985.1 MAG: hypothetical protein A3A61_01020 [Candidatus Woykebacteria bacterium RIFCSPLOWO2_01_FULL_43_14]